MESLEDYLLILSICFASVFSLCMGFIMGWRTFRDREEFNLLVRGKPKPPVEELAVPKPDNMKRIAERREKARAEKEMAQKEAVPVEHGVYDQEKDQPPIAAEEQGGVEDTMIVVPIEPPPEKKVVAITKDRVPPRTGATAITDPSQPTPSQGKHRR